MSAWNNVVDGLPEYGVSCSLFCIGSVDGFVDVGWCNGSHWLEYNGLSRIEADVTHWMPLPEPPSE